MWRISVVIWTYLSHHIDNTQRENIRHQQKTIENACSNSLRRVYHVPQSVLSPSLRLCVSRATLSTGSRRTQREVTPIAATRARLGRQYIWRRQQQKSQENACSNSLNFRQTKNKEGSIMYLNQSWAHRSACVSAGQPHPSSKLVWV